MTEQVRREDRPTILILAILSKRLCRGAALWPGEFPPGNFLPGDFSPGDLSPGDGWIRRG